MHFAEQLISLGEYNQWDWKISPQKKQKNKKKKKNPTKNKKKNNNIIT